MTPVFQLYQHDGKHTGDCVRASVASILDLKASEVPNFLAARKPDKSLSDFLGKRGLFKIAITHDPSEVLDDRWPDEWTYVLLGVKSIKGDWEHSLVGRAKCGELIEIVHDPNPESQGLYSGKDVIDVGLFVKIFAQPITTED